MANIKLDFSKMKHVKSDAKSTTLKHPDGHEITLAHKALSPENQTRLMALAGISKSAQTPQQATEMANQMSEGGSAKMAEGGRVKAAWGFGSNPVSDDPSSPKYDHSEAVGKYGVDVANTREIRSMHNQDLETGDPILPTKSSPAPSSASNRMASPNSVSANQDDSIDRDSSAAPKYVPAWAQKTQPSQMPAPKPKPAITPQVPIQVDNQGNPFAEAKGGMISPSNGIATITGQAKGGSIQDQGLPDHPGGSETCHACGGLVRKAYADPQQPVSNQDGAPQIPTNLDPNSAGVPTSVPNYRDPNQASIEPKSKVPEQILRQEQKYNEDINSGGRDEAFLKAVGKTNYDNEFSPQGDFPKRGANTDVWNKAGTEVAQQDAKNMAAAAQNQQAVISENLMRSQTGAPLLQVPDIPQGPQVPGSPENPPQPNAINPAGQPVDDFDKNTNDMLTLSNQGFHNQIAGIKGTAQAQEGLAAQQAAIYDAQRLAEQNILDKYQKNYDAIDGEMNAVRSDIANSHITPENYWTGDSEGNGSHSKIATGIGMILAGFNPTNRPNAAVDFLKFNMEQNLKAQVQEMTKKENVLTSLQNKFRNMHDTMDFSRLINSQMAQAQLASAAANATGGPNGLAANAAKTAQGQLELQYAPLRQKIAMSQTMMHLAANPSGNPDIDVAQANKMSRYATAMGDTDRAKQWQQATVPGIGVTKNLAPVPDKARDQIIAHKNLQNLLSQAYSISQKAGTATSWDQIQGGQTLINELTSALRTAEDQGVYKESDAKFLKSTIGSNPAGFAAAWTSSPQLKELINLKQNEYNNLLNTYNLPTQHFAPQGNNTNLSPQAAMQWTKSNPNDPRAQKILQRLGK